MTNAPEDLDLCIYHDPCADGFTAAWSVWKKWGNSVQYVPIRLDREKNGMDDHWLNLVKNKHVVICDCSFGRDLLLKAHAQAKSLIVLDHHLSNMEELNDLPFCYFDMKRSGAGITWDTFHPDKLPHNRPMLVNYVENRDLWVNSLPYIEEISALVHSAPKTFKSYSELAEKLDSNFGLMVEMGKASLAARLEIAKMAAQHVEEWDLNGHKIKACNSTSMPSEVCTEMFQANQTAQVLGCYWLGNGKITWSLRGRNKTSGIRVDQIAHDFGGGGHASAAGFSVSVDKVDFVGRKVLK
jgi:oligoribonuclease NrnB/cAMP/cGMP phosphodiesterase (DHH superfamily)